MTERFCQDPLEKQRAIGARKDNPSIRDFRFNNNSIRNQKIFRPAAGNVCRQDIGMVDLARLKNGIWKLEKMAIGNRAYYKKHFFTYHEETHT